MAHHGSRKDRHKHQVAVRAYPAGLYVTGESQVVERCAGRPACRSDAYLAVCPRLAWSGHWRCPDDAHTQHDLLSGQSACSSTEVVSPIWICAGSSKVRRSDHCAPRHGCGAASCTEAASRMILVAAAVAAAQPAPVAEPPAQPISEAVHAIEAGRLEQARIMIANAVQGRLPMSQLIITPWRGRSGRSP